VGERACREIDAKHDFVRGCPRVSGHQEVNAGLPDRRKRLYRRRGCIGSYRRWSQRARARSQQGEGRRGCGPKEGTSPPCPRNTTLLAVVMWHAHIH